MGRSGVETAEPKPTEVAQVEEKNQSKGSSGERKTPQKVQI